MLGLVAGCHVGQQLVACGLVQASGAHLQHLKGEGEGGVVREEEMEGLDMSHERAPSLDCPGGHQRMFRDDERLSTN